VLEIVPRNSPSVLRYIAIDIHSFATDKNVRLSARKCKLLPISFLHYDSSVWPPLFLAGAEIDSVGSFKFISFASCLCTNESIYFQHTLPTKLLLDILSK